MYTILLVAHSILVVFLIIMVLIQRTDSDGLSGLGGGGGGNQFMTGGAAANLLTRTTAVLAGLFMLSSLVLDVMASHMTNHSIVDSIKTEEHNPVEKASEPANLGPVKAKEPINAAPPAIGTSTVPKPE